MADPAHVAKLLEGVSAWNEWRTDNPETTPDLRGVDLSKEAVSNTALIEIDQDTGGTFVNLRGVNLREARLQGATLVAACLDEADLKKANLKEANLRGASLFRANIEATLLVKASLEEAHLEHANLHSAHLGAASLQGARLDSANLQGARLFNTNLQDARLVSADLRRAFLLDADLRRADFRGANLEEAHLQRIMFDRNTRQRSFQGIRVATCYGSQGFKTFAQDQNYIEELRLSGWRGNLMFWVWWIFADCGRSFWRWAGWSIVFAVGFGLYYYWMGPEHFDIGVLKFKPLAMLYYSVVTFTTLGFGDIKPMTDTGLIVVMAEVILGYIMLGGLISIFANKVARRA